MSSWGRCRYYMMALVLMIKAFSAPAQAPYQRSILPPKTIIDLEKQEPLKLRQPSNLKTEFVYDPSSNLYLLITKLGDQILGSPIVFSPKEYLDFISRESRNQRFLSLAQADKTSGAKGGKKKFNPFDIQFDLGIAEKIFGPGGIRLRTQGSAELSFGIKHTKTDNPALSEKARKHTFFDFNEKIQASVQASVGNKLSFNLSYNTASTFEIDAKKLKLTFDGEEDDIVKLVEAGNVSISPRNSLISGGASLFGVHSKLQFGRLTLDMVLSQQKSESRRVQSKGGVQLTPFDIAGDEYDADRHFFLGYYFRDHYEEALKHLPYVSSPVRINRVEVWVTNKRGKYDNARNLVAFVDLGEPRQVSNSTIGLGGGSLPSNAANTLYQTLLGLPSLRRIDRVGQSLSASFRSSRDYEKVESARKLSESEYTLNPSLGYISLANKLSSDEVLAVAYEYTVAGKVYKVGEFSTDRPDQSEENLYLKLLKGTNVVPSMPYWGLMMRNAYSLGVGVGQIEQQQFQLEVNYRSDETGIRTPYLPIASSDTPLVALLGLDRTDSRGRAQSDGLFDFVEGYTIDSRLGVVFFPLLEPFSSGLKSAFPGKPEIDSYTFGALYNKTLVAAREEAARNKFSIKGQYRSSSSGLINLGAMNVAQGSVKVLAGGQQLKENVDYTVDYLAGTVKILNQQILESGTPVEVSLENNAMMSMQRKTMFGIDLNYEFSRNFQLGATLMHLSEMPMIDKTTLGQEALKNTLWGMNLSYRNEGMWLTNILDKLPLLDLSSPSEVQLTAEFAHSIPGHYTSRYNQGYSYLDDFESSQSEIELMSPYAWSLASAPQDEASDALVPEAKLINDLRYGAHRAHLSWFSIDPLFQRERSSLTPGYIRNNPDYVSNHFVREIESYELYPYRDLGVGERSYLSTFSLCYYPEEPGPYNLNESLDERGFLREPRRSWAGIMRRIEQSDFESMGVEYLEFWLMDPFVYEAGAEGGDLYINLGEISEDILHDERKFFENGLSSGDQPAPTEETVWGRVPIRSSTGYAFDNTSGAREKQDVGFDGLSSEEEQLFPSYKSYLERIRAQLSPETLQRWQQDPQSPLNDPAHDDFHHYRGGDYDEQRLEILERYKYYNGTEGNSRVTDGDGEGYSLASRMMPDIEDINQDNNLSEEERYFQYHISLRPRDLVVGQNYITDERISEVTLRNGQRSAVRWFQFKIPLRQYQKAVGGISDFRSIRFMRLLLGQFSRRVNLRLASLKLIRGDWRVYQQPLYDQSTPPITVAESSASAISLEENGDRSPINYVLPPGVSRSLDGQGAQASQQNEQSLSLKVNQLAPGDACAIYKNIGFDLRRYKKLELFAHAEQSVEDNTHTEDGDMYLFLRLGTDFSSNYYEYALPLKLTASGSYNNNNERDRSLVWPIENQMQLDLEELVKLKTRRNRAIEEGQASYYQQYREQVDALGREMLVLGNPSLSDISTLMIGVRNRSGAVRSIEVWLNELRLGDYHEEGGWAANATLGLKLSDLATVNLRAQYLSAGFGALDQSLWERRMDDFRGINLSSQIDLGRLLPRSVKLKLPVYYSYNAEKTTPEYNPLDPDVKLKDALREASSTSKKDSLEIYAVKRRVSHGFSLSNARLAIKSKEPMPYDPDNLSLSYTYNTTHEESPEVAYDNHRDWQLQLSYDYRPTFKPLRPFARLQGKGLASKFLRQLTFSPWPSQLSLSTSLVRSYQEVEQRDLSRSGQTLQQMPVMVMQHFLWNRRIILSWDLTPRLVFTFNNATDARIEEPFMQVNKRLNPDGYAVWRDSVMHSIREGGKPMKYQQQASLSYSLPTNLFEPLNWISAQLAYSSSYRWDLGAETLDPNYQVGNVVNNQMSLSLNGTMNLRNLFSKSKYLRDLIRRVETRQKASVGKKQKKSSSGVTLGEYLLYSLMMWRDLNFSYRQERSNYISGFLPQIGSLVGQGSVAAGAAPGWSFAFGLGDDRLVDRWAERGWLLGGEGNVNPSVHTTTETLDVRATLNPLPDLNISLSFTRSHQHRVENSYMYPEHPRSYGGSFMMSTIGLKGFFQQAKGEDGYQARAFEDFLSRQRSTHQALKQEFLGDLLPAGGFLQGNGGGTPITETNILLEENAPAVLIPSFRQSYTYSRGREIIPHLTALLPNWSLSYSGLSKTPLLEDLFRSITLKHAYTGAYRIDSYTSYPTWVGADPDELGFVPPAQGDISSSSYLATASLAYDIASVSLQESFSPLIGLDFSLENGLGSSLSWRKSRTVVLGLAAYQLIESSSDEFTLGLNYKVADVSSLWRPKPRRRGRASKVVASPKGLTLRLGYSYRRGLALIRKIQGHFTQATSGNMEQRINFSADYDLSKMITLKLFADWSLSRPIISTSSFPITNSNLGLSMRLNLSQ